MADERQREYQRKYDKKTKMISVKYILSDMREYDRLKEYLEKTGQSANSFIKSLINDFFEQKKYVLNEEKIADYFKDYNVDGELLDKLKNKVGGDRFNMIMDYYKDGIESELCDAYVEKGDDFDEWIEQFIEDIEAGDIDTNVPDKEFEKIIDLSISQNMGYVYYSIWSPYHNFINLSSVPKFKIGIT